MGIIGDGAMGRWQMTLAIGCPGVQATSENAPHQPNTKIYLQWIIQPQKAHALDVPRSEASRPTFATLHRGCAHSSTLFCEVDGWRNVPSNLYSFLEWNQEMARDLGRQETHTLPSSKCLLTVSEFTSKVAVIVLTSVHQLRKEPS